MAISKITEYRLYGHDCDWLRDKRAINDEEVSLMTQEEKEDWVGTLSSAIPKLEAQIAEKSALVQPADPTRPNYFLDQREQSKEIQEMIKRKAQNEYTLAKLQAALA